MANPANVANLANGLCSRFVHVVRTTVDNSSMQYRIGEPIENLSTIV